MNIENKKTIKTISQAPTSLALNPRKIKLINKNQGMLSKYELSVPKDNTIYNLKNQNEIEKEEYGYELEQSYDNNANFLTENKNVLTSFTNDKSNGENIDNMHKYDSYSYKIIKKAKKKVPNYNDHGISSYNSINNNNGYIDYKMNNEEIDNEWNNPQIHFDGVNRIASKVGSAVGNQNEYANKLIKNNINNPSNINKELKKENNNIFKNFIQMNENNDLNDFIDENNNFTSDNKTIKKSVILQQVLINEMKKEIEGLKMEKENMQKKYNSEKDNIINEYNKTINSILQENNKLNEIIKNQKNEIKNINKICREKIIELEQVNKMMESFKIDNGKNKNSTTENDNFEFSNIKDENSKNSLKEKNYIKLNNQNIIKGRDFYERKTEESNINTRDKNNELMEEKYITIIDNLYDTIKQVTNNIKFISDKLDDNSEYVIDRLKIIIEKININNNGYTDRNETISIDDKIEAINEFNNIIKLEVNELLNYIKNNIINYKISSNNKIDKHNTQNINNLNSSENGQNYFNEIKTKKYYTNNNLFKKIDIKSNKFKNNRILNELNDDNFSYSKKRFIKYNAKNKNININKSKDDIIFNKNDMVYNRTISLKSNLLEKNSVVYKSNISPMSKEYYLNSSNNHENDKFSSSLNNLINRIIRNNGEENRSENSFNKLKNIKLNTKVKEISDLINNNKITKNNNITSFEEKNFKKSKIPMPEDIKINNSLNIFPTFNKIKENKLSISNNNSHRNKLSEKNLRPIYKNSSEYFSLNNCNTFASIPLISTYKTINHKKNTSMSSNFISKKTDRNKYSELESIKTENRIIDSYMKMSNLFKSFNNSYLSSNTIESQMSKTKTETTPNRISSNSFSSLGNKNTYVRIENDENKFLPKILLNKEKFRNNNNNINGLTNEIMRPSFLKSNAVLSLNYNNSEKRREKTLYNEYKK